MSGDESIEDILKSIIGEPTGTSTVIVERGPVTFFADAVLEQSLVYKDLRAAQAAGFPNIPAPPTYPIAMESWGKYPELQDGHPAPPHPLAKVIGPLMSRGGIILHGEQEFLYHRPVTVGDVLVGSGKVVDAYQKESKGRTMTFVVTETVWTDAESGEQVVTSRFNVIHRA